MWSLIRLGRCACYTNRLFVQLFDDLRHYVVEVANNAEIGKREDGCVLVAVDSADDLRAAHARHVLDLARHAQAQ
jgi:hypothetical protein